MWEDIQMTNNHEKIFILPSNQVVIKSKWTKATFKYYFKTIRFQGKLTFANTKSMVRMWRYRNFHILFLWQTTVWVWCKSLWENWPIASQVQISTSYNTRIPFQDRPLKSPSTGTHWDMPGKVNRGFGNSPVFIIRSLDQHIWLDSHNVISYCS